MQLELENMKSIPSWDKFGLMGKLMGNATKGKWHFSLFVLVWLIMFLPGLAVAIVLAPVWLPVIFYQTWQQRNRDNQQ